MVTESEAAQTAELPIVIPVYNEQDSLPHLHKALVEALPELDRSWEVLLINDGSFGASEASEGVWAVLPLVGAHMRCPSSRSKDHPRTLSHGTHVWLIVNDRPFH